MRFLKSKKAQDEGEGIMMTSKWALYMVLAIVIPLMGMVFAMYITGYQIQENSYLDDVENKIVQARFFNSPDCFAYQDSVTGRTYPGMIDLEKFKQDRLDRCYIVPGNFVNACFKIELVDLDTGDKLGNIETSNFPKCIMMYSTKRLPNYVTIKKGEEIRSGIMFIESKVVK
jgi:hypothetical protein